MCQVPIIGPSPPKAQGTSHLIQEPCMGGMNKKDVKSSKQLAQGRPDPGSLTCPGLQRRYSEVPDYSPAPDSGILIKYKGSTSLFVKQKNFCLSYCIHYLVPKALKDM